MINTTHNNVKACPVCLNSKFAELINFGLLPQSGSILLRREQKFQEKQLIFEYCLSCSLIRRHCFDKLCPDYRRVHRQTQNQMPVYINEIIYYLIKMHGNRDGLIVDIGGNDGAFMDLVAEAGYQNRLIIEPSGFLSSVCKEREHFVENVYFNSFEAERIRKEYGPAKIIFCRHVLEHVPDPEEFFNALKIMTADDGLVFIEIPDAQGITRGLLGHELWDEHLFHFSEEHLCAMAERFGYEIQWKAIKPHRGGTNLLLWAKLGRGKRVKSFQSAGNNLEFCHTFKDRWMNFSRELQLHSQKWSEPIGLLGASHPQTNFALFTGIGGKIDLMVDDDPDKINTFVPLPHSVPVISTYQLLTRKHIGTLLLSAFGCQDWIEKIRKPLSEKGTLLIDPYHFIEPA